MYTHTYTQMTHIHHTYTETHIHTRTPLEYTECEAQYHATNESLYTYMHIFRLDWIGVDWNWDRIALHQSSLVDFDQIRRIGPVGILKRIDLEFQGEAEFR